MTDDEQRMTEADPLGASRPEGIQMDRYTDSYGYVWERTYIGEYGRLVATPVVSADWESWQSIEDRYGPMKRVNTDADGGAIMGRRERYKEALRSAPTLRDGRNQDRQADAAMAVADSEIASLVAKWGQITKKFHGELGRSQNAEIEYRIENARLRAENQRLRDSAHVDRCTELECALCEFLGGTDD